jgi:hypothetical protein
MDSAQMPKYVSHKTVHALKIKEVFVEEDGSATLTPEHTYEPIPVAADWYNKHRPSAGGYYVVYKDGYASFSPAEAFEEGYTLVV